MTLLRSLVFIGWLALMPASLAGDPDGATPAYRFTMRACEMLPAEQAYDYHKFLKTGPIHVPQRVHGTTPRADELAISETGWTIAIEGGGAPLIRHAAEDLRAYLKKSMDVTVSVDEMDSLKGGRGRSRVIIAGTKEQLPEFGKGLRASKDYRILVDGERIIVCGFDDAGVMFGLYNLEDRMSLRGGPFVRQDLDTVRHSLYQTRMVLNWMGWMEWPDTYLSRIAHDGFDGIFASVYANPNGVEGPPHYNLIRDQRPAQLKDVVQRAKKQGIKVYAPILYAYTGTPQNEEKLREHVRDIVTQFPDIHGYILLTEGFFYEEFFGAGGHGQRDLRDWARHWTKAVAIVAEECHKIDPTIEILPWEYNVDFRPEKAELKRYVLSLLPEETIPLVTWENGKSFQLGPFEGYLRDYSINEIGPAEVTAAQVAEADERGMTIYSKVDTFASWQFGTTPYLPIPYQWKRRYEALREYDIDGTLETWSNGYKPNFVVDIRCWYCWSDAPPFEELLRDIARREFGAGSEDLVLDAWRHFSKGIQSVPDTGPTMGTNNALANPLFFQKPHPRMMNLEHSWWDRRQWGHRITGSKVTPYWPFTHARMVFMPDFSNRRNAAEGYARSASGVAGLADGGELSGTAVLPVFNKHLLAAADEFETGLKSYRKAALAAPKAKRKGALKEVLLVEQMQRMMRGLHAILEFENLRFNLSKTKDSEKQAAMLDRMVAILKAERLRTRASLETARRDSRLGYEFEQDYVYRPYVLEEKLEVLEATLEDYIPAYREEHGIP